MFKKILFVLLAVVLAVPALAAWSDVPSGVTPQVCPANNPGCNTPLNVSINKQVKAGIINALGGLEVGLPKPFAVTSVAGGSLTAGLTYTYRYGITVNGVTEVLVSGDSNPVTTSATNRAVAVTIDLPANVPGGLSSTNGLIYSVYRSASNNPTVWYKASGNISAIAGTRVNFYDYGTSNTIVSFTNNSNVYKSDTQINGALKLPLVNAGLNKILAATDNFGSTAWKTAAELGINGGNATNYWTLAGSSLYNNAGTSVGLGTVLPDPAYKLTVQGNTKQVGNHYVSGGSILNTGSYLFGTSFLGNNKIGYNTGLTFHANNAVPQMKLTEAGRLGISTENPIAKVDIVGNIAIRDGSQGLGKVLTSDVNGVASWKSQTPVLLDTPITIMVKGTNGEGNGGFLTTAEKGGIIDIKNNSIPDDAKELLLFAHINLTTGTGDTILNYRWPNVGNWKKFIIANRNYSNNNSLWIPLDSNGRLEWTYTCPSAGCDDVNYVLFEIQGYR